MSHEAKAPSRMRLRARLLTPITGGGVTYLDDAEVLVSGGRIEEVSVGSNGAHDAIDLRPAVLAPGFVDVHLHYPQTRVIGSATGPLLPWLEATVFPEEARFTDGDYARTVAREFLRRAARAGSTTLCAFASSHLSATQVLFEEALSLGVRLTAGLVLMDQGCPDGVRVEASRALAESRDLIQAWHGAGSGLLSFAVTPRFAPSCSRALLEGAAALAHDHQLLVQTHVAEHPDEEALALSVHPFGRDYLDIYDRVGLLHGRTLLAHSIHLSRAGWDLLAERGARVAHCPDSNFFLGSGRMPIPEPVSRGIAIGLGTDVAAGRTFDVRRVAASAFDSALCLTPPSRLSAATLFELATLGGARSLGLDHVTGSIEVGKDADFALLDVPAWVTGPGDVLAHAMLDSEGAPVLATYVRGARVYSA
jgi:guanine deaminase